MFRASSLSLVLMLAAVCGLDVPASAQTLPPGFELVPVPGAFDDPTGMKFAPDGTMLILQKGGVVLVHDGSAVQPLPFIDLSTEINSDWDRGLLGLAFHPGWAADDGATSWVYLLYPVSSQPGNDPAYGPSNSFGFSRLARYKATLSAGQLVADLASREVLIGHPLPDGAVPDAIASLHNSHSNGSLIFASDGTLFVTAGDGAHWDLTDNGGNDDAGFDDFVHPVSGQKGPTPAAQDAGAFRSQQLESMAGKVLRIDPATGLGLPGNPFYDGDPASNPSRVWALGLRNPFRVALAPAGTLDGSSDVLAIGDVGWFLREELNLCQGGENFGWPCQEGFAQVGSYQGFNPPGPTFPNCNTAQAGTPTNPALAWHHFQASDLKPAGVHLDTNGAPGNGFVGSCAVGGTFYPGGSYPAEHDGRLFIGDWTGGWIKTVEFAGGSATAAQDFASGLGFLVALESHPVTGDVHCVVIYDGGGIGRVHKLRFAAGLDPWVDLGNALAGATGEPVLGADGTLLADDPVNFALASAAASSAAWMVIGSSVAALPFKGGILTPSPDIVVGGLMTDAAGGWQLSAPWPSGVPAALTLHYQVWIADATGPAGFAASNALSGTTP